MPGVINKSGPSYIRRKGDAEKALKEVTKNLEKILKTVGEVSGESLDNIAKEIKKKSDEYAPLDKGDLRNSSYTSSEKQGNKYTAEVGYKADHAIYLHENYGTSYANPTTQGTKPKFLESAATEIESDIPRIVAEDIKKVIK